MNDEFLYQLREPPSKRFTKELKARLEMQSAVAAARRKFARWVVLCSVLVGATAVALFDPLNMRATHSPHADEQRHVSTPERDADAVEASLPSAKPAAPLAASSAPELVTSAAEPSDQLRTDAVPRHIVKAFALGQSELLADLIGSFQETYGFEARTESVLCLGARHVDIAVSVGRIEGAARTACESYGIRFIEVPIAYDAYVALAHRDNTWVNSLRLEDLRAIGRPSWDPLTTWNQIRPEWPSLPITVLGLTAQEPNALFAPAREVRPLPFTISKDDVRVPTLIDAAYGGLGLMTFATYERQVTDEQGRPRPLLARVIPVINARGDAVLPTRKAIQDGSYEVLSRPLYLYVNVDSVRRNPVALFATHAIESFSQQLDRYGYTKIDKATMDASARQVRSASRQ